MAERHSSAEYELLFEAVLQPLTFNRFYLQKSLNERQVPEVIPISDNIQSDITISNDRLKVVIDSKTGLLKSIQKENSNLKIEQNFGYYTRNLWEKPSGAYAMHTDGRDPTLIADKPKISITKGKVCQQVIQEFNSYLKQIIRVYRNSDEIEFEWTVGPLPYEEDFELITRFDTDLRSYQTFYTDSNGKQTLKRMRDMRENWNLSTTEEVSSNYYPITSWIFIRDEFRDLQLTVMPDRAQGGSSLKDGSVELMIHRRLHTDDGYGMDENLNETGDDGNGLVVTGKHVLVIDRIEESMKLVKNLNQKLFLKPLPIFIPLSTNLSQTTNLLKSESNSISINLIDPSVHLLTLEELEENVLFIRLEYFYEINKSKTESVSLSLKQLFSGIEILEAIETGLTGTELLSDLMARKYQWNCDVCENQIYENDNPLDTNIILNYNQIRSFILRVKRIESNIV